MPNVYMSPTGSDSNDGLTPSTPVLTTTKAVSLLTNLAGVEQTIFLRGGTYTSRLVFDGTNKKGSPTGWINIKNYPGEKVIIAPTPPNSEQLYVYVMKINLPFYWRIQAEAPSDPLDYNTYNIIINGGSTGIYSRTGLPYNPTLDKAGIVAGDYIKGYSGLNVAGNATKALQDAGTNTKFAEVINVAIVNCHTCCVNIAGIGDQVALRGCYAANGVMSNYNYFWQDYKIATDPTYKGTGGWAYGITITSGNPIYSDGLGTYLNGPFIIEDNIVDNQWGESIGCYACKDVTMQHNRVVEPHRIGIYTDALDGFQVLDNDIIFPSDSIDPYGNNFYCGYCFSSEKSDKVIKNGLVARNRIVCKNGLVFNLRIGTPPTANNITIAHNTIISTTGYAINQSSNVIDSSTVRFINNIIEGSVSGVTTATWISNAFNSNPSTICLNNGGFVNANLGLLKATPLTRLGYTKEYCRPSGSSPVLQAGTVITSVPVGDISTDTEGNTWETIPSLGPFRSTIIIPAVSTNGLVIFFGGTLSGSPISISEIEIAESIGGVDITGSASIIRGTSLVSSLANMTDNNNNTASTMTGDGSVLFLWSTAKSLVEIRIKVSADETSPRYIVAYDVKFNRGRRKLTKIGRWICGVPDSNGWLTFSISSSADSIIKRARSTIDSLF